MDDNNKKPWEKSFDSDQKVNVSENDDANPTLSRMQIRKQKGNFKLILAILISIVALIAIFSLAFGISNQNSIKDTTKTTTTKSKNSTNEKKNNNKQEQKKDNTADDKTKEGNKDSQADNNGQTQTNNSQTDNNQTVSTPATSNVSTSTGTTTQTANTQSNANSQTNATQTTTPQYVTVNSNEGFYKIASNAGITIQQLQNLNGLNANSVINPGQRLRVK
ncbi:LysM domain-containing protein [Fructilactobacillus vespulae]|uniref:LysM peptidoglycan-binding domain-containing protein n=1 Tax=Fructilactobacillus vespulae TaxID=1249630 RepID=UPI0039B6A5A4